MSSLSQRKEVMMSSNPIFESFCLVFRLSYDSCTVDFFLYDFLLNFILGLIPRQNDPKINLSLLISLKIFLRVLLDDLVKKNHRHFDLDTSQGRGEEWLLQFSNNHDFLSNCSNLKAHISRSVILEVNLFTRFCR